MEQLWCKNTNFLNFFDKVSITFDAEGWEDISWRVCEEGYKKLGIYLEIHHYSYFMDF